MPEDADAGIPAESGIVAPSPIRWLVPVIVWACVIFVTSCRHIDRDTFIRFVARFLPGQATRNIWTELWIACGIVFVKGYHVAEFALLAHLAFVALRKLRPQSAPRKQLWLAAALCFAYAASDEWHQTFVPGCGGRVTDVLIDAIGITLVFAWNRWRMNRPARGDS